MRQFRMFIFALLGLSLLVVSAPAQAETFSDCQVQIAALREATETADLIGRNAEKDRAGLLGKLDSAVAKLSEGKGDDAVVALTQYHEKVATLNAQGKINVDNAATLIEDAADAIACIAPPVPEAEAGA